jgi:hypothetical protein
VYLIHQSAKDYLDENYTSRLQPAGVAQGHADISRRSIAAMSSILKRNIYNLDFGYEPSNLSPPQPDLLAPIRYSWVFWADHLVIDDSSECKRELMDDGEVLEFLKERFLHWIESLSLLGNVWDGVLSIEKLLHAVQVCSGSWSIHSSLTVLSSRIRVPNLLDFWKMPTSLSAATDG